MITRNQDIPPQLLLEEIREQLGYLALSGNSQLSFLRENPIPRVLLPTQLWNLPLPRVTQQDQWSALWECWWKRTRMDTTIIIGPQIPVWALIEELNDPTTKMQVANVFKSAVALNVQRLILVVNNVPRAHEAANLYDRAKKVIRTFHLLSRPIQAFVLDLPQIPELHQQVMSNITKQPYPPPHFHPKDCKRRNPVKYQSVEEVREALRWLGSHFGFLVCETYQPPVFKGQYACLREMQGKLSYKQGNEEYFERILGKKTSYSLQERDKPVKGPGQWFSIPKISLIWGIPLPDSESPFLNILANLDDDYRTNLRAPNWHANGIFPVFGFEIEYAISSRTGGRWEHVLGSAFYLSTYCRQGVIVMFDEARLMDLKEYLNVLGIKNVLPVLAKDVLQSAISMK